MSPTLLREIGIALGGPRWQSAIAHRLDVDRRTIWRWMAGEAPIPADVGAELEEAIHERSMLLIELRDRL